MIEFDKYNRLLNAVIQCDDYMVRRFFDLENEQNIDFKIEVLEKVNSGTPLMQIDGWEKILDKLPPDGEMWD